MGMSIYELSVRNAAGQEVELSAYRGKVLLIVNVASACGFTPQYAGLEFLYRRFRDQGLSILAFPCNDFGGQEPGDITEIQAFCSREYGVTFDMFAKLNILGDDAHPLYRHLTGESEPAGPVAWNFEKFLIGRDGRIAARYPSRTAPDDPELIRTIEAQLAQGEADA